MINCQILYSSFAFPKYCNWYGKFAIAGAGKFVNSVSWRFRFHMWNSKRWIKSKSYFLNNLIALILKFWIQDLCKRCPFMWANFSFVFWCHFFIFVTDFDSDSFEIDIDNLWRFTSFLKLIKLFFVIFRNLLFLLTVFFWLSLNFDSADWALVSKLSVLHQAFGTETVTTLVNFEGLDHENEADWTRCINFIITFLDFFLGLWFLLFLFHYLFKC